MIQLIITGMKDPFTDKALEILEERSQKIVTRKMYPRSINEAGGFSKKFLRALKSEVETLKAQNEKIQTPQILKALDFEIRDI